MSLHLDRGAVAAPSRRPVARGRPSLCPSVLEAPQRAVFRRTRCPLTGIGRLGPNGGDHWPIGKLPWTGSERGPRWCGSERQHQQHGWRQARHVSDGRSLAVELVGHRGSQSVAGRFLATETAARTHTPAASETGRAVRRRRYLDPLERNSTAEHALWCLTGSDLCEDHHSEYPDDDRKWPIGGILWGWSSLSVRRLASS